MDGGSNDGTIEEVHRSRSDPTLVSLTPGTRSRQLMEGVRVSEGVYLLFLHADSYLPETFSMVQFARTSRRWGWFDCRLSGSSLLDRVIERAITLRSSLLTSPTGDQAIWVHRELLNTVGGIPGIPLMEDVELSRRLREVEPGKRFALPVTTSSRRWRENGYLKTILTMWILKLAYYAGIKPSILARVYYGRTNT